MNRPMTCVRYGCGHTSTDPEAFTEGVVCMRCVDKDHAEQEPPPRHVHGAYVDTLTQLVEAMEV